MLEYSQAISRIWFESTLSRALRGFAALRGEPKPEVIMTQSKILVIRLGDAKRLTKGSIGENVELDARPQP